MFSVYFRSFSSTNVTSTSKVSPSRQIVNVIVSPTLRVFFTVRISLVAEAGFPFTAVMMSPCCMPFAAASDFSSTAET